MLSGRCDVVWGLVREDRREPQWGHCTGAGGRERSRPRRARDGFRRIGRRRRPGLVLTCAPVGRSAYEASVKEYWDRGVTLISGLTLIEPTAPGGEDRFQVGFPGLFRLLFSV